MARKARGCRHYQTDCSKLCDQYPWGWSIRQIASETTGLTPDVLGEKEREGTHTTPQNFRMVPETRRVTSAYVRNESPDCTVLGHDRPQLTRARNQRIAAHRPTKPLRLRHRGEVGEAVAEILSPWAMPFENQPINRAGLVQLPTGRVCGAPSIFDR